MTEDMIKQTLQSQRDFFASQATKPIAFRKQQLKKLYTAIEKYEKPLYEAFWTDLHKSEEEAFLTELSIVYLEIKSHLKHLNRWARPKRVAANLTTMPSKSRIIYEPLGVALIIAPWNYPLNLLFTPLVGAISSGCCAVLKPSPYVPNVSNVMEQIIKDTFPENYISIFQGHRDMNTLLLNQRYDLIFFTGSPVLGKTVMAAAAKNLTPLVLELGGKSPCIVEKDANLKVAAKRIMWGKTINAGQTCIAPDYMFVHENVKDELIKYMEEALLQFFGEDPQKSDYFPHIVSEKAMTRLKKLMVDGNIVHGGKIDEADRYIEPTLIDDVKPDYPIMQEEIFGPLLPIMTFSNIDTVVDYINTHEKPLAFYFFGKNKAAKDILLRTTSGGACINDTLLHFANDKLPFGGVGNSGMGKYHNHENFLAFSNRRACVKSFNFFDLSMKFAPFKGVNAFRGLLK